MLTRAAKWYLRKQHPRTGDGWSEWFKQVLSLAPVSYSATAARELPAVAGGVRLLSNTVATLPLEVFRRGSDDALPENDPEVMLVTRRWAPGGYETRGRALRRLVASDVLHGFGAAYVLRDGRRIERIIPLDPARLTRENRSGRVLYRYDTGTATGLVPPHPEREDLIVVEYEPPLDGVKFVSPFRDSWPAIRAGIAANRWAGRYFDRGAQPEMVVQPTADVKSSMTEARRDLVRQLSQMRGDGERFMFAPGGYSVSPIGNSAREADLLGMRRYAVEEVARVTQIPPILLQDLSRSTYANFTTAMTAFGLRAAELADTVAEEMSAILWPDGSRLCRFDTEQITKQPMRERYEAYKLALDAGWKSVNQVREMEGDEPLAGEEWDIPRRGGMTPGGQDAGTRSGEAPGDPARRNGKASAGRLEAADYDALGSASD